tara:strand:- start:38 stop:328 length:291 start_codon:yes stop_codon:yes gene_type:complete
MTAKEYAAYKRKRTPKSSDEGGSFGPSATETKQGSSLTTAQKKADAKARAAKAKAKAKALQKSREKRARQERNRKITHSGGKGGTSYGTPRRVTHA